MSFQVTLAAGRTETGQRQMVLSFGNGGRNRDETRAPKAERGTRGRPAKSPGRQRESLGRRAWRGVQRSRGMAVARVAGGIARDGLAKTPLGQLVSKIAAPVVQAGRNVQRRWTDVRARQQGLGKPTRTPQQQQVINLKGQRTKAQNQLAQANKTIKELRAQLDAYKQGGAQTPSRTSSTAPPAKPAPQQKNGKNVSPKNTTSKTKTTGRGSPTRTGGKDKAQQSRSGKLKTTAKTQRTTTRGAR